MQKFVIERQVPGAGKLSPADLKSMAAKSCDVLRGMDSRALWQHSYVTDGKIFCVYIAEDEQAVREHAERGGFPVNQISVVRTIIDPATAE